MNERRRKLVPVSNVFMHGNMPVVGDVIHVKCTNGLPADAVFIGLTYDHMRDAYYFCYQSEQWDDVPDCMELPVFVPTFMSIQIEPFLDQAEKLIETMYSSDANKWLEEYRAFKKQVEW